MSYKNLFIGLLAFAAANVSSAAKGPQVKSPDGKVVEPVTENVTANPVSGSIVNTLNTTPNSPIRKFSRPSCNAQ